MNIWGSGAQEIGTYPDPFTLPGSQITALLDNMTAWAARVHRQSRNAEQTAELYFFRLDAPGAATGAWYSLPIQPLMDPRRHLVLTQRYREPAMLEAAILDYDSLLFPTNLESPYNYFPSGDPDILLDEARKILLRVGVRAWENLASGIVPAASAAPTAGQLATLTDSLFALWNSLPVDITTYAAWTTTDTTPLMLTLNLGSVQQVKHVAARFGTLSQAPPGFATWTLPASLQIQLAIDGTDWISYPIRPVGGEGSATQLPGDWDDAYSADPTTTTTNLLGLPGFETGYTAGFGVAAPSPWVAVSGTSHLGSATTGDPVHAGDNCCALSTDGIQQSVSYQPGQPLTACCWFCLQQPGPTTAATVQIRIDLLAADNSVLHTRTGPSISLTDDNLYRQFSLQWPSPPDDPAVTQARVTYRVVSWTGQEPLVDDCALYITTTQTLQALDPCVTEIAFTDLEQSARYVRFVITPTGAQTLALDEIAVYGGTLSAFAGRNLFCGYLGDQIEATPEGVISFTATDVLKKLADNNETTLTSRFGNVDVADICYALLTGAPYWRGSPGAYDAPWLPAELSWTTGQSLTGLIMPLWQGENNNHLGYQYELWHEVGWQLYADGNGVLTPLEPPYQQARPERVMINAPDGNGDARRCRREISGKDLRNVVEVRTGRPKQGSAGSIELYDPNSVALYGHRRNIITDPVATDSGLRMKLAAQVLRDYGHRVNTLECEIAPDFDTRLRQVHGFRTALRPALYARACTVVGSRRKQELWSLQEIEHHITSGSWWGEARYIPYMMQPLSPPQVIGVSSTTSGPYLFTLSWQQDTDPGLAGFNVYLSSAGSSGPFTRQNGSLIPVSAVSYAVNAPAGTTAGQEFYVYATAVDTHGNESVPGQVLPILAGGGAFNTSAWTVTDLSAGFDEVTGPDSQGFTTYQFFLQWTSPPIPAPDPDNPAFGGFKRMQISLAAGSLSGFDPTKWPCQWPYANVGEWSGNRIPPGEVGTGKNTFAAPFTPGQLTYQVRFKPVDSNGNPVQFASGTPIYIAMFTSSCTHGWGGCIVSRSNIATFSMP